MNLSDRTRNTKLPFSKTTEKASLIYQKLKKRKNQLEKKKTKKLIET